VLKPIQSFYYLGPKGEGPLQVTFKCVCLEPKRFKVHLSSFLFTLSVVHSNPGVFSCFMMRWLLQIWLGSATMRGRRALLCLTHHQHGCELHTAVALSVGGDMQGGRGPGWLVPKLSWAAGQWNPGLRWKQPAGIFYG